MRSNSELDEKTRSLVLHAIETERRRWMEERGQQLSAQMERESEWRIVSERAAECERLRLVSEEKCRELEMALSEEQRKAFERERIIEVAKAEMEKLSKRTNSEILVKEAEISALRKDNMSVRVTLEELDKRRRIEMDQIQKKGELERKENEQLKEYYKRRLEEQEKSIEDLKRLLTKDTFRLPASSGLSQTETKLSTVDVGADEDFFRSFNRLRPPYMPEQEPIVIDRENYIERIVPNLVRHVYDDRLETPDLIEVKEVQDFSFDNAPVELASHKITPLKATHELSFMNLN